MNRKRILIVDDDRELSEVLKLRLEAFGWEVECAASGSEALRMINENPPDAVISDFYLGDTTGAELFEKIRNTEKTKSIPLILLSGKTKTPELLNQLTKSSVIFVQKPYGAEELLHAIENAESHLSSAKRLLVIDDEEDILSSLSDFFSEKGYKVQTAHDGIEGLDEIKKEKPDVIILDLFMPRMNGFAFMDEMRKHADLSLIPVIVVSGHYKEDIIPREKKPQAFFEKPFAPEQIVEKIKHLLS